MIELTYAGELIHQARNNASSAVRKQSLKEAKQHLAKAKAKAKTPAEQAEVRRVAMLVANLERQVTGYSGLGQTQNEGGLPKWITMGAIAAGVWYLWKHYKDKPAFGLRRNASFKCPHCPPSSPSNKAETCNLCHKDRQCVECGKCAKCHPKPTKSKRKKPVKHTAEEQEFVNELDLKDMGYISDPDEEPE